MRSIITRLRHDLTIIYAALTALALISTLFLFMIGSELASLEDYSYLINISGRQRMLSQQIALYATLYSTEPQTLYRTRLLEAVEELESNLKLLVERPLSPDLQAIYFDEPVQLQRQVLQYAAEARLMTGTLQDKTAPQPETILPASSTLLDDLNTAVNLYQAEAEARIHQLLQLQNLLRGVVLTALLSQAVFVFRPIVRRLQEKTRHLEHEIDQRRQIEDELRATVALKKTIFDSANLSIVAVDTQGIIKDFNRAAEEWLGYSAEEIIGSKSPAIFHDPDLVKRRAAELSAELGTPIAPGFEVFAAKPRLGTIYEDEWIYIRKDGSRFPVWLSISARRDEHGSVMGYVGIARDLTEEKQNAAQKQQLLDELKTVNQDLQDFAYVVSHDLKAPLRAIGSLSDWLVMDYGDKFDGEGREMLDLLKQRVARMNALIDGVLQYSRIGRINEDKRLVAGEKLIAETLELLVPPPHIEIRVETPLPLLYGEPTRLEQVFQNLIGNAIRFIDKPQGLVRVGATQTEGVWRFYVADNGPGIEQQHFTRIFQIFQTLQPRDELESTGIGLAIVKRIVEIYDGSVWLESTPGAGTTFYFTLPGAEHHADEKQFPHSAG